MTLESMTSPRATFSHAKHPSRRDRSAQIHEFTKSKPQKNHTQTPYPQAFMNNTHFPEKFSCPHEEISLNRERKSQKTL
jgi:hypothetical protein